MPVLEEIMISSVPFSIYGIIIRMESTHNIPYSDTDSELEILRLGKIR